MVRGQSACRLGPAIVFQLFQFCNVKTWPAGFCSLGTRRSDLQRQDRPDEAVVSPALPSPLPNRSCDSDVTDVSATTDGIVNQMPLFRSGVHPLCLVLICLAEQCVGDGEVFLSTETQLHEAV